MKYPTPCISRIPAVRLPAALYHDTRAEAQRRGVPVSTIVRDALAAQLATKAQPQATPENAK